MRATWLPQVLAAAGLDVSTHPGWQARGRDFVVARLAVVLHHDASPPGDSPGVPAWMADQIDHAKAGAQLWVSRAGAWTVVASGLTYHAGNVQPGSPSNANSLGVETDHTTGEPWPPAQLAAVRVGVAAILTHQHLGPDALHFHSTICRPRGRKVDPDGLDLSAERAAVAGTPRGPVSTVAAPARPPAIPLPVRPASAPPFPLPDGWYYGPRTGPRESVSGYKGRGEGLGQWQTRMAARGWIITADSLYGPQTAGVARTFQTEKHLHVDALIGPNTWAAAWTETIT